MRNLRNLSPRLFHQKSGDELVEAAYESTLVLQNNGNVFFLAIQAFLQLAVFLPVLFFISWQLTLFLFVVIVPLVSFLQRKVHRLGPEEESLLHERSSLRGDINFARRFFRNWSAPFERHALMLELRKKIGRVNDNGCRTGIRKNVLSLTTEAVSVVAMIFVLSFCAVLISRGWMDNVSLVLFCSAVLLCYKPIKECARLIPQFRSACSACKVLQSFGNLPKRERVPVTTKGYGFRLENADFCYDGSDIPVYSSFTLNMESGKPVLLRGENGVGKSTLLRLLSGLEEWSAGQALPSGVFFLAQDLELPPRWLLLRLLEKCSPEVRDFIEFCHAGNLLEKEGLSGGERARVALVWALASPSRILLLDEPLASVALAQRNSILCRFLDAADSLQKWVVIASHDSMDSELLERFKILDLNHG